MTRREIYDLALNTITNRRQYALANAKRSKDEIYLKIPQIQVLEQKLALASIKLSKFIISKGDSQTTSISQIMTENVETQENIEALLINSGYAKDAMLPKFYCKKCSDTAYVLGERCTCFKELVRKISIEDFNSNSAVGLCSFNEFLLKYYSQTPKLPNTPSDYEIMSKIHEFCISYSNGFSKTSPSILMIGNTGLGKTHLSLAIASELIGKGYNVLYGNAQEFFTKVQNEHFGKGDAGADTMNTMLQADLLILDDVGAEYESNFNNTTLYSIINSRLNKNRPTIINTNLTLKQIESRYSSRVASRLATLYKCLKFVGVDVRQLKLRENV